MLYAMMEKKLSCSCDEAGDPKKLLPSLIRRQGRSSEVAERSIIHSICLLGPLIDGTRSVNVFE